MSEMVNTPRGAVPRKMLDFTTIFALLKGFGIDLGMVKSKGIEWGLNQLAQLFDAQEDKLLDEASERLTNDNVDDALTAPPGKMYTDKDGEVMNALQWVMHEALFAIPRAISGGTLADWLRDPHFEKWGRLEAETMLAGVTDVRQAVQLVFNRLREQANV